MLSKYVYLVVLVQNKYKNTFVGVLRTQITFVRHSSPSCYVTLRTQVIRLNSGNLGPQKTDTGVFIIVSGTPESKNVPGNGHCRAPSPPAMLCPKRSYGFKTLKIKKI